MPQICHCEEQSDAAIPITARTIGCFAARPLMTLAKVGMDIPGLRRQAEPKN
jgi:hypothetical protein